MSNVAILGEEQYIYGFGLLGLRCFYIQDEATARSALDEILAGDFKLVFILERWQRVLEDQLQGIERQALPVIVPIKDNLSKLDLIKERLKQASLSASGVDLTKKG